MKIFSWVHRRFNNKGENVKNNDGENNACDEEQFPVNGDKCDEVFERWRGGGILTIGTFGYDPFNDHQNHDNAYFSENDDDDDYDDDDSEKDELYDIDNGDEEHNPLVLSAYSFNAEDHESVGRFTEVEMEENWSHGDELKFGFEYVMMKKKERITLADLFCADSDKNHDDTNTNMKKQTLTKSDLVKDKSNGKPGTKDARPIHKLNQLMRRMLKRKIHPDVGPTNAKVAGASCNNKCRSSTTDDSASLLPTQGALSPLNLITRSVFEKVH